MNGAEFLCKLLKDKGAEYVFGLFGDVETDFAHAISKSSIKWVGVHNEKCGGFMADIYARTSGKAGLVFTTLGPGATNLTSALANANQDRSPLIAISDQVPTDQIFPGAHQYIDFSKAFHPDTGITKWAKLVNSLNELPEVIEKAYEIALTEPKGAVHICIPSNLFSVKVLNTIKANHNSKVKKTTNFDSKMYNRIVREMSGNGLVIVGGSVERADAQEVFRKFIEKHQFPVFTTFRGKNSIPSDHPLCLGTISRHLKGVFDSVLERIDYIVTIGYDFNEGVLPSLWKNRVAKVINIDSYNNKVAGVFEPSLSLIGDLKIILKKLSEEKGISHKPSLSFAKVKDEVQQAVLSELKVKDESVSPHRIIDAVNQVYNENSIILCDIGLNKYYSGLLLKSTKSNKILFSNGMSSMAFTSGSLGAKIASPKSHVIALVGDGGFLMDLQEIITTVQYKQPIVWLIFNNGGLGLIEQAQLKNGRSHHGVKFGKVIFEKLAEALGVFGARVEAHTDLVAVLEEAKKSNQPAIIDVVVEYS